MNNSSWVPNLTVMYENTHRKYTDIDRFKVEYMCSRGVSDIEIVLKTGFKIGFVGRVTRAYWNNKMLNK